MQICNCRFSQWSVSNTCLLSYWTWRCILHMHMLLSTDCEAAFTGCEALELSTLINKLKMKGVANFHRQAFTGMYPVFTAIQAAAATVAQCTIFERHFIHTPMAHRPLQPSSSLRTCSLSLLGNLFKTPCHIPLAFVAKLLLCSLQVFLGSRTKHPQSLYTSFPIPCVEVLLALGGSALLTTQIWAVGLKVWLYFLSNFFLYFFLLLLLKLCLSIGLNHPIWSDQPYHLHCNHLHNNIEQVPFFSP